MKEVATGGTDRWDLDSPGVHTTEVEAFDKTDGRSFRLAHPAENVLVDSIMGGTPAGCYPRLVQKRVNKLNIRDDEDARVGRVEQVMGVGRVEKSIC